MSNQVIECLMNHRSIRRFKKETIPEDIIETILKAGIRAANGGNLQSYSFIVIDDEETRKKLDSLDKYNNFADAPLIIIALADIYRIQRWFDISDTAPTCINKPVNLYLSSWDAIIALQNVTIAAESLGLGGYYIGNILEFDVQELLNLPKHTLPVGMVCIGYPDKDKKLMPRLPLEAVVHRNSYKIPTDDEIKCYYEEEEKIWDRLSDAKKDRLAKDGIYSVPQATAKQKFPEEFVKWRSKRILSNIEKFGFDL